jgi:hypothetical protein
VARSQSDPACLAKQVFDIAVDEAEDPVCEVRRHPSKGRAGDCRVARQEQSDSHQNSVARSQVRVRGHAGIVSMGVTGINEPRRSL